MYSEEQKFARFGQWLLDGGPAREPGLSYERICRRLRIAPASLDACARKELGMDGREILHCFHFFLNLWATAKKRCNKTKIQ